MTKFQTPRPKEYSSGQANSKKVPITEFPMSKTRTPSLQTIWSLEFGPSDISWNLVFGTWNFNCLSDCFSPWLARQGRQAGMLILGTWNFIRENIQFDG